MSPKRNAHRPRSRRAVLASLAAAVVALGLMPALAGAQGGDQYQPSPVPEAPTPQDTDPPSGAPEDGVTDSGAVDDGSSSGGVVSDDGASSEAADTVTDSSGSVDELPVTGLAAAPLAVAGLVMLLLGALGLRRYSGPSDAEDAARDPSDPSGTRRILGR